MRSVAIALAVILGCAAPLQASDGADRLSRAMKLDEAIEILRDEGLVQIQELEDDMLGDGGGSYFRQRTQAIYDPKAMSATMSQALEESLTDSQMERAAVFFESDLGQLIVSLENSARRAYGDPAIEDMGRANFETVDRDSPFFTLVDEYVRVNDLLEQNLQGGLSSDFSFFRGLKDGQGISGDDQLLLQQLMSDIDDTREEIEIWLYGFLLLAYQPLSDAQLRENIAFSRTETGQALNAALFDGFGQIYDRISYELGLAISQAMTASDL